MTSTRNLGALFGTLGFVGLLLVQVLPWGGVNDSAFGFSSSSDAYTWTRNDSGSGWGFSGQDSVGWYSPDAGEDEDGNPLQGVAQIRLGIPFLLAGLVVSLVGALMSFSRGSAGPMTLLVGGVLAGAGTLLFAMGVDDIYAAQQTWGPAFYLAIAGTVAALVGGSVSLGTGQGRRSAS